MQQSLSTSAVRSAALLLILRWTTLHSGQTMKFRRQKTRCQKRAEEDMVLEILVCKLILDCYGAGIMNLGVGERNKKK